MAAEKLDEEAQQPLSTKRKAESLESSTKIQKLEPNGAQIEDDDSASEEDYEEEEDEETIDRKGKGIMIEDVKGKGKLIEESESDDDDDDDSGSDFDDDDVDEDPLAEVDLDNILPSRTRNRGRVAQRGISMSDNGGRDGEK